MSDVAPPRGRTPLERPRFELVPVKGVDEEIDHLPRAANVTVTCSPAKGIEATLALGERLHAQGFDAVPHLSARLVADKQHAERIVARASEAGLGDVFLIGGDVKEPLGPYPSALALLRDLRELRYEGAAGVAGYPEPHPFISSDELWRTLYEKQTLASYIVTQICFDAHRIVAWLRELRARGIGLPVWIGFPGVVERRKLMRIALRIGVGVSSRYLTKQGDLVSRLVRPGGYNPDELVHALEPYVADRSLGIAGYHINTFNQVAPTERWRKAALEATRAEDSSAARS
jgi:methylenetetrahydrofolate reductase (NADPH)